MGEEVISDIEEEIQVIEQLFSSYAQLFKKVRKGKPDLVEMTAIASVLHSFYNGVENILLRIAKEIDLEAPSASTAFRKYAGIRTPLNPHRIYGMQYQV